MLTTINSSPIGKPLWVTVKQAEALTNIGHTKFYALIKSGVIKTTKVGSRTLIWFESLENLGKAVA